MPEHPLQLRLDPISGRPGVHTLTCDTMHYSVTLDPERTSAFSNLLRRLPAALVGERDPAGELAPQALLRAIGTYLWQALSPDDAPAEQRDTLARTLRSGTVPLLLTLPDVLAGLPWELLCDPERGDEQGFLARRRPLLRFVPAEVSLPATEPPLRVLVLISSPLSLGEDSRVDVESERAAIEQATREAREAGLLHVWFEDFVTPKRVQQALMRFRPHIVHYIGHGGYDEQAGGVLLWEDEQGHELPFTDRRLADLLRPRRLHAVVLHACQTGRRDARSDVLGVAGTLVREGMSAVLAQQGSFTYASSQRTSETWYTALTSGLGFADALFEVRQALVQADRPDWAVPILYGNAACLKPLLDSGAAPGPPDPALANSRSADLPTPTGVFVGRHHELRALRLLLESQPGSGPVLALITGPGGVGKSTLAAQAVTRYGSRYKAILTLSCLGYQNVELFLQRLGEWLKRQDAPGMLEVILPDAKLSIPAKIEAAIEALNQAGPVLLIVDNLESVQQDDQRLRDPDLLLLLQKLLTNLQGGRVLLTGRYAVQGLLPDGRFAAHLLHLDLDDLSRYETAQLLTRHDKLAGLGEITRQTLIQEFGGLPYVYDLLNDDAMVQSLDRLLSDIQGRITRERQQRSAQEWQLIRRQVVEFAALESTVARLAPPSRQLLARLSVLERPCPLSAIEQGLEAERAIWRPLLERSLLRYDTQQESYRLHSLTRHYAGNLLDEQERAQAQSRLAAWYEHYADHESHNLADYLEAHSLYRAAGALQPAGELVMHLAEPLQRFGLYTLLRELCTTTKDDLQDDDEALTARALHQLGIIAQAQGEYAEARRLYQQSLEIKARLGDQGGKATTLHQLGMIAQTQGDYAEARRLYQQSLETFERLGDQSGKASSLGQLGTIAYLQGGYAEARRLYQQSLETFKRLGDQSGKATTLHQLGNVAYLQGDYAEARRLHQQSLETFERLGDQRGKASSLGELGTIAYLQGEYAEARRLYQQSLEIKARLGDQSGKANSLYQLGMIAQTQGEYAEARRLYQQSLEIKARLGDQSGKASSLGQLGNVAYLQGDYAEARRLYQQSLETFKRLGDQGSKATTLHQLGMIAYKQGDYAEAQRLYQQSLEIKARLGDQRGRATTLHQLGTIVQDQGDYVEARRLYQQSLETFERLGDQSGKASSLGELGNVAYLQGDYAEARRLYQQSLEIDERLGDQSGKAATLHQLGMIAYEQGDLEQALVLTIQTFLLLDTLHAPARATALRMLARIRKRMDEARFIGHWRALAGERPLPDLPQIDDRQSLMQTVIDFIQAPTWQASQRFLKAHPELLQPEVDAVLLELAAQQEHEGARQTIETYRLLLQRCREIGIAAAFAEQVAEQDPESTFLAALNDLCVQVIRVLGTGETEQREALSIQIEHMMQGDLPVEGTREFLQVLVAWLHGQDAQALERQVQALPSPFREAYERMVSAVEQETIPRPVAADPEEASALTLEDLPHAVAAAILGGTAEQRQQFAVALEEARQQLPTEVAPLGRFLGCLAAALRDETPESAALEAPFTDLWQAFLDALQTETNEQEEEKGENDA